MPQNELGTRIEPLVSDPSAIGTRPPATAPSRAAGRSAGHVLEIVRIARRTVVGILSGEVIGVFAHVERADEDGACASSRETSVASRFAGARSRLIFEPARVGSPSTSKRFLTAKGAPASGPRLSPRARAASIASALTSARAAVTSVKAPSASLRASIRCERRFGHLARARRAAHNRSCDRLS